MTKKRKIFLYGAAIGGAATDPNRDQWLVMFANHLADKLNNSNKNFEIVKVPITQYDSSNNHLGRKQHYKSPINEKIKYFPVDQTVTLQDEETLDTLTFSTRWAHRDLLCWHNEFHHFSETTKNSNVKNVIYYGHYQELYQDGLKKGGDWYKLGTLVPQHPHFDPQKDLNSNCFEWKRWLFRPKRWVEDNELPDWNPIHKKLFWQGFFASAGHYGRDCLYWLLHEQLNDMCLNTYGGGNKNHHMYKHKHVVDGLDNVNTKGKQLFTSGNDFLKACSSYLVNLSLSGVKDMCYRDIELFSVGCPMIRPRFTAQLMVDIPDDVYIPIDFVARKDGPLADIEPADHEKLAYDIIDTWNNVKNDKEYLTKVSKNAKEFWREHFSNEKQLELGSKLVTEHFDL